MAEEGGKKIARYSAVISTGSCHCVDRAVYELVLHLTEEFTVQVFLFADLLLLLRQWHDFSTPFSQIRFRGVVVRS
jgi:hypothetical protein